jgi:acyl carrier protein
MTEQEILNRLTGLLRDLLSDESIVLTMGTKRDEVPNWDSFAYVSFIVAVETDFHVKFGVAEVESFQNVGAIVRRIGAIVLTRPATAEDAR